MEMILKQGREWAIKHGYAPTGRKLGVGQVANTALYRIQYVDDKPSRMHPPYDGMYTKPILAQEDLDRYLREFWDTSEREAQKRNRADHAARVIKLEGADAVSAG